MNKKFQKQIANMELEAELVNFKERMETQKLEAKNRSRSITVGTAFGGSTEITMRGNGDKFLYAILQPVEVAELIHQLSANIGCHLALKPREDFSSWRHWKVSDAQRIHLNGHPPFPNDMATFQALGTGSFDEEKALKLLKNDPVHENIPQITESKKSVKQKRILNKKEIKEQQ